MATHSELRERHALFVALVAECLTLAEIALRLGVSRVAAREALRRRGLRAAEPAVPDVWPERIALVRAEFDAGLTDKEIARKLGMRRYHVVSARRRGDMVRKHGRPSRHPAKHPDILSEAAGASD